MLTSLGGAVSTAARPNNIGDAPGSGEGLKGLRGDTERSASSDIRPFTGTDPEVGIGLVARELRRPVGVTNELVREKLRRPEPGVDVLKLGDRARNSFTGLRLRVDALGFRSSSSHCKWRITDLVAHCGTSLSIVHNISEFYSPSFVFPSRQTI